MNSPLPLLIGLSLAWLSASGERLSYDGYKIASVSIRNRDDFRALVDLQAEARITALTLGEVGGSSRVLLPPGSAGEGIFSLLRDLGLDFNVGDDDVGSMFKIEREAIERRAREWRKSRQDDRPVKFDIYNFHNHDEINQYLQDLSDYYETVSVRTVGTSFEGRDLNVLSICSSAEGCGANNKSALFIDAGIHAREWIGPSSAIYMIDYLVQTLDVENDADLVSDVDWYFLPVYNPDGYQYTINVDRNWRKTRHVYPDNACVGVDPNRNFPYRWGLDGSSGVHCSDIYRGEEPLSEPELVAVTAFVEGLFPAVKYYQNLHSAANLIMYPWAYSTNETYCENEENPDAEAQQILGDDANAALFAYEGTVYDVGPLCEIIYAASGNAVDWGYALAGVKYSFTNELREGSHPNPFVVDPEDIVPNGEEMMAFHRVVARSVASEFPAGAK